MYKSVLIGIVVSPLLVSTAYANMPTVSIEGMIDTQYGIVSQKVHHIHDSANDSAGPIVRDNGLVNDTHVTVKAHGTIKHFEYGGLVKLNSDTSASKDDDMNVAEKTMGYVSNSLGRIEFGSYTGASRALQVSANNIARATGGIDGDARYWWNQDPGDVDYPRNVGYHILARDAYLTVPQLYANNPILVGIKGVNSSKITYYAPTYKGFMAGVSYIPDLLSHGTVFQASQVFRDKVIETVGGLNFDDAEDSSVYMAAMYKDVLEGGIRYDGNYGPYEWSASIVGQTGTPKLFHETISNSAPDDIPFNKLRAWSVGAAGKYQNVTVAAAYGNNKKSGQMVQNPFMEGGIRSSTYWNIGAAYARDRFGISATYMRSKRGMTVGSIIDGPWINLPERPRFSMLSIGGDYQLARGCQVYAELNLFKQNLILGNDRDEGEEMHNRGHILLIGSKTRF